MGTIARKDPQAAFMVAEVVEGLIIDAAFILVMLMLVV